MVNGDGFRYLALSNGLEIFNRRPAKATPDLERGAGISLQALQAHARLAQQAGISVGITRGYEVARVAAVLDRLLNTHTPHSSPSCHMRSFS